VHVAVAATQFATQATATGDIITRPAAFATAGVNGNSSSWAATSRRWALYAILAHPYAALTWAPTLQTWLRSRLAGLQAMRKSTSWMAFFFAFVKTALLIFVLLLESEYLRDDSMFRVSIRSSTGSAPLLGKYTMDDSQVITLSYRPPYHVTLAPLTILPASEPGSSASRFKTKMQARRRADCPFIVPCCIDLLTTCTWNGKLCLQSKRPGWGSAV
jgi:hypothetical protein